MTHGFRILVFAVAAIAAMGAAHGQEYVIRFAHVVASDTPKGRAANMFAKLVDERLAGKVRVEVYPDSDLYDDDEVLTGMLLNARDDFTIMAAPSLSKFLRFSKELQVFDLPFLFDNMQEVHKLVESPLASEITASLEEKGLKALVFWDNGMKVFSVRGETPLRQTPEDFNGKTFRIQNSDVSAATVQALGGEPWRTPFRVVYMSLDKGIVDGQENAWSNILSQNFHQVQDWITVSNHAYLGYLVVVNNKFWNGLPGEIRSELEAILKEVTLANRGFAAEETVEDRRRVEKASAAKVVELTPEERKQWREATASVEQQFAPEIGPDLLTKIHQLLGH